MVTNDGDHGDDAARSATHPRCWQPFMTDSVAILKYLRAAEHFRRLLLERRMATAMVRWYRGCRDRRLFLKQVRRMTECWLPSTSKYLWLWQSQRPLPACTTVGKVQAMYFFWMTFG